MMEPSAYLTTLRADAERLAVAAERDLETKVPTCPDWTMAELVVHLGRVHRWVDGMVRNKSTERGEFPGRPDDGADLLQWFREGADQLVESLGSVDPDQPIWNWGDGKARFWHRRQAQETAIHRWDAQHAIADEQPVDAALAVDGIDELLDLIIGPSMAGRECGAGESIHLHATDREGEWTVTFGREGVTIDRGHAKGDAAVRGTASDLVLFAWNRISPDAESLETFGDTSILQRWRVDFTV